MRRRSPPTLAKDLQELILPTVTVADRLIRMTIAPVALMTLLTSIVVMAIAASLESHWSSVGFPSNSYRDRERLLLVAGIWGIIVSGGSISGLTSRRVVEDVSEQ